MTFLLSVLRLDLNYGQKAAILKVTLTQALYSTVLAKEEQRGNAILY